MTPDAASETEHAEQDAAHGALARAVARLVEASVLTEVPLDEVRSVTAEVDRLSERLETQATEGSLGSVVSDAGVRNHGNAVRGLRNPLAVVPDEQRWVEDDRLHFRFRLGAAYEGPPHHVHGGVLALVLDQALGEAAAVFGGPGMTGRLTLHFRRATPLGDASTEAWVESSSGGKTVAKGRLYDAEGHLCVEAEGLFIFPKWAADHPQWARLSSERVR
ncbi:PaaI family thioesterase [Nocardioides marmoribigeumensis]|uniref:Acyl-coenzyme A thioesterase PaaI-like protein n=1 Tax=Nocardioides marmoribigeumensis TaxID=433649 RepID=A0ABU2BVV5_9ACTN|nr:PaaI family thioesterase [Nocardioides marmoribigeumensis]MDR7362144.1 acyl-coenzyme A thioesterase PaaI-like protein [Nocardioides marmoribigeumensis]